MIVENDGYLIVRPRDNGSRPTGRMPDAITKFELAQRRHFSTFLTTKFRRPPMHRAIILALSALALAGCQEKRVVTALKPPPERLQCVATGERPRIPAEYQIDWTRVQTVPQAKLEHEKFVATLRTREGIVAGYLIQVEGRLFACASNAQWLRDWFSKLD